MRKPHGYATFTDRESGKIIEEVDTFQCSHCSKVTHVKPFCDPADLGGYCTLCNKYICASFAYLASLGKPCIPWHERIARLETRMEHGEKFYDPLHRDD